ncbi:MAG: hypothetical protein ACFE8N_10945 [Promethearchaeota archaeon]
MTNCTSSDISNEFGKMEHFLWKAADNLDEALKILERINNATDADMVRFGQRIKILQGFINDLINAKDKLKFHCA